MSGFDEFLGSVAAELCDVEGCALRAFETTSTGRALCREHVERRELLASGVCLCCREEDADRDGSGYCAACRDLLVEEGSA